jgi:hypothetical protein
VAVAGGGLVPLLLAAAGAAGGAGAGAPAAAAVLALAGGAVWDYIWIEAGQSVPLS